MAPSAHDQLKNRIERHRKHIEQFKIAKEKKFQSSEAIMEHLKLVQQALNSMEKENVDVRALTSTFDNIKI
ncbi:hypothetical protein CAEBREN_17078 [Caenorhabditis brenneri]|uniref:Uncharacterized protein n=1 Tax=Caenorhabditis brenneri TaxID=135651 RepID=G0NC78_CAEBE|nr:hypothetical protein CAEBREN_17078 [Caenorhabditis brenneri]